MLDSFKVPQPTQSPNHSFHVAAHTNMHPFNRHLSGTTWVSRYQKGKTNLHFTEARDSGSGISWAICKSAARSRQITMPALHHSSFFTGWMPSCRQTNSVKALKAFHVAAIKAKTLNIG